MISVITPPNPVVFRRVHPPVMINDDKRVSTCIARSMCNIRESNVSALSKLIEPVEGNGT